ncbi:dde family endonuclease [Gigaspora margarita]|uniref:Dde family endonuclease n=1 Tax=Gigaspora margarita TaxID=4874 RepID=A0A8H4AGV2_GIGMA|nr:dde family endonuclease [Gigaspora margarita]
MKDLETLMPQFVGDNMEIVINSEISEENQIHILVTHDECTFYANDSCSSVWAPLGIQLLHKKGMGKALMVLKFLTEICGHFTITLTEINELNLPPTFLQKAIPIFEATHPNCIGVFAFDNSTNHSAFAVMHYVLKI